ncbi:MAG: pyridine nucleotide-disulfide oxidoreductase, partial [Alphaproteobacteria bacterium]
MDLTLGFGLSFQDLHTLEGLAHLDQHFLDFLGEEGLGGLVEKARDCPHTLEPSQESQLMLKLAPHVEAFIAKLFGICAEVDALREAQHHATALFRCKRLFIQRQAAVAFSREASALNPDAL